MDKGTIKNKLGMIGSYLALSGGVANSSMAQEIPSVQQVMNKAKQGSALNVVFFGGSLTWGANASDPNLTSWRGRTMAMLREKYPMARWNFFDAAIGGTGSYCGIFRLERDILKRNPDLVILEFTMNDGIDGRPEGIHDQNNQSYEAILRNCLSRKIAVLPVILTFQKQVIMPSEDSLARRQQHRELFRYYQLEYADVMGQLRRAYQAGTLDPASCWPAGLFDEVHPHDKGYQSFADAFRIEWERIQAAAPLAPRIPDEWISGETYRGVSRVEAQDLPLPRGWKLDFPLWQADTFDWLSSRWVDRVAYAGNAIYKGYGNYEYAATEIVPLELKFRGECVIAFLDGTPQNAELEITIDGHSRRDNSWLPRNARIDIRRWGDKLDPDAIHTLRIRPILEDGKIGVIRLGCLGFAGRHGAGLVTETKASNIQ